MQIIREFITPEITMLINKYNHLLLKDNGMLTSMPVEFSIMQTDIQLQNKYLFKILCLAIFLISYCALYNKL